jgi:hypothetical protein
MLPMRSMVLLSAVERNAVVNAPWPARRAAAGTFKIAYCKAAGAAGGSQIPSLAVGRSVNSTIGWSGAARRAGQTVLLASASNLQRTRKSRWCRAVLWVRVQQVPPWPSTGVGG